MDVSATIDAIWRIEAPRIVGALLRITHDLALAEELAQEALLTALERWPVQGIPESPSAWLVTTAKHRALDELRRNKMRARKHEVLGRELDEPHTPDLEARIDERVEDDVLRLVLVACHPVLSTEARVALTLRLVVGLTTEEIARAFLAAEPTIAQRILRAKRTLSEARVPFEVPTGAELATRMGSVLEVVYLVFNEGHVATSGDDLMRPQLCDEALRLGRMLAALVPGEAEVHGLLALMELSAARAAARVDERGEPVLLMDQDRTRWSPLLIHRGLESLARAEALGRPLGPYTLQAAIAACHARARTAEETDWRRIVALYDALVEITGSPIVELNRAVAVGMAYGPEQALELVDALQREAVLRDYHLLYAVRADLLIKLGDAREARAELERAAFLAKNGRERALLRERAARLR